MRSGPFSRAHSSGTILLVDDNKDGVIARRSLLEELGYQVVSACCGQDALQNIEQQKFDLVITDFKMSPINGLELIASLRERDFKSPIILLTGFAESLGLRPDETGADVVIQKSSNEVATLLRHTRRLLPPPAKRPARSEDSPNNDPRRRNTG